MSIREQAAAVAESFGPTGRMIARAILDLPQSIVEDPDAEAPVKNTLPPTLITLLSDARNMIALRRPISAGGHARPEDDLMFRLDVVIFGQNEMPNVPEAAREASEADQHA